MLLLYSGLAGAQNAAPSAEQMIEQLKARPPAPAAPPAAPDAAGSPAAPHTPNAPRTRGLRNLAVEAAPAPLPAGQAPAPSDGTTPAAHAPAAKPSLSLLIQFDLNSARVKPESQQALANLAVALQSQELAASKFAVEGHTDATGRADHNLRLSSQRADAVRDFLAARGVEAKRLVASGKGSAELANAADPAAAENRRVRIVNLD